jgi:adenylate kinase
VAKHLSAWDGSVVLSTGRLLRAALADGTPLGRSAESYMLRGELVPDSVIRALVEQPLRACAGRGFILAGYPRTIPQAVSLEFILLQLGLCLDLVADLTPPMDVLLERLDNRRTCTSPACQEVYNLQSCPPGPGGVCRLCGHPVAPRADETEGAIQNQLRLHRDQCAPMAGHYQRKDLLLTVREADTQAAVAQILGAVAVRRRMPVL